MIRELNHPFVVKYIDDFIDKKKLLCQVYEYMSDGDLEQLMDKQKIFSE